MNDRTVLKPLITEKSLQFVSRGWYTFVVPVMARKPAIASAINHAYNVTVTNIRSMRMPGKSRRVGKARKAQQLTDWKKVLVTLSKNQTIDAFQVTEQQGK